MKMQQAPSTSTSTASEALEEDATQSENDINIAKMVHFNVEDKENPAQPSA